MAMIIDLQPAIARSTLAARPRSSASAEIVFFPGIRYERAEPAVPQKERAAKARRRDTLELPED